MRAGTNEDDHLALSLAIKTINQKKIAPDVTLAMTRPLAPQRMVQPFWTQRLVIGDEE